MTVIGITVAVTFKYCPQLMWTLPFFKICIHINVASVPIGNSKEPISLPMTLARYEIFNVSGSSPIFVNVSVPTIRAGWLLNRFDSRDNKPPIKTLACSKLPEMIG